MIISFEALADLERLRRFLRVKNPRAAKAAADMIVQSLQGLELFPEMGRPLEAQSGGIRELVIRFGRDGCVAKYRYDGTVVFVLAIKHYREESY